MENFITGKNANLMLTAPQSETQKAYYSLHAAELSAFTYSLSVIQAAWAFTDWKAASALLDNGMSDFPTLVLLTKFLAIITLFFLHYVLHVTCKTAFAKYLQGDKSKGNFALPIIIGISMFALSVFGAFKFAVGFSHKAEITAIDETTYNSLKSESAMIYTDECKAIEQKYASKASAKAASAYAEIARLKRKTVISDNDQRWVNKLIAEQQHLIDRAAYPFAAAKNADLAKALERRNANFDAANAERTGAMKSTIAHNDSEVIKAAEGEASANRFSWVASLLFLSLFYLICYKICKIRFHSGIEKNIEFTPIEQYGGILALAKNVLSDIFSRKAFQFLSFLHKKAVSGTQELSNIDTTLRIVENSFTNLVTPLQINTVTAKRNPIGFGERDKTGNIKAVTVKQTVITPVTTENTVTVTNNDVHVTEIVKQYKMRISQVQDIGKGRAAKTVRQHLSDAIFKMDVILKDGVLTDKYKKEAIDFQNKCTAAIAELDKKEVKND